MARVLIVEDELLVARGLAKVLEAHGHEVVGVVSSGAAAIAAIDPLPPDVVLMDIRLRGDLDGIAAAAAIRARTDVAIVFLTAYGDRDHVERAKAVDPMGYLIKPYGDREVVATVEIAALRHAQQRALARRERWLDTLLHSIGDGVIAVAPDLRVHSMNAAAERLTGWRDAAARGHPLSEVLVVGAAADRYPLDEPLQRAMARREVVRLTDVLTLTGGDAAGHPVDTSVGAIVDDDGQVLGGVVVLRDVSARQALETQLAVSERMASLTTLTAAIGHELNNPLGYNLGNLEAATAQNLPALRAALATGDDARARALAAELTQRLDDALAGARRMHEVLSTLQVISRPDTPERRPLPLVDLLERALRLTDNELTQRGTVVREFRATPEVLAHEGRLVQVFVNLLINAAQALPEAGPRPREVRVTVDATATTAVVEVIDTGVGIPAELMVRVFEPFFTTRPVGVGTGLGLAVAHRIVTQHGGEIGVTSQVGAGTTVRVVLPRAAPRPRPVTTAPPPARRTVLLIDDDPLVLRVFARVLREAHDVTAVESAAHALTHLATATPDVIVCDLMMPGMTGIDLHEHLLAHAPAMAARMMFVTGGAFTSRAQDFATAMGARVLTKPVAPAELLLAVLRVAQ